MINIALSFLYFLRKNRSFPKVEGAMMKLMRNFPLFANHIVVVDFFDGIKARLSLDDLIQQHLFAHGYYEPDETAMWKYFIKNSEVVIDIGANVGYYSLLAAKYATGKVAVFAFEPMTLTFNRAKTNIGLNAFSNIHLFQLALSDKKKKETIIITEKSNWGTSNIVHHTIPGNAYSEEVDTITLDSFVHDYSLAKADVIKIDVEGYEPFVLSGMKKTISQFRPVIFIEVFAQTLAKFNFTPDDIFTTFREFGYEAYMILPNQKLRLLKKSVSMYGLILFAPQGDLRILPEMITDIQ